MNFKKIIRINLIVVGFVLVALILITSTTGFEIQKNPMDHFFSQHQSIDSSTIDQKLSKDLLIEDIDFMVKTISDVHPNMYQISKDEFQFKVDSIKSSIDSSLTRREFWPILISITSLIKDGHTQVKFPEISNDEDSKSNFDKAHNNIDSILIFNRYSDSIAYLKVRDFVIGKNEFATYINSIFQVIDEQKINSLIIDIRNNSGGNSELADYLISCIYDRPFKTNSKILIKRSEQYYSFMQDYFSWWVRPILIFIKPIREYRNTPVGEVYSDLKGYKSNSNLPYRFKGEIYILINSNTFSTALGFATVIKDYKIGTIVGEPTRAIVNEYGDIYPFDLPHSKLWVWCSTKQYIRPSGEISSDVLMPDIIIKDKNDAIVEQTIIMIKNK